MFKLVNMHRAFLIKETVVSMMINLLLSAAITFLTFRSQTTIMLWGSGGLFFDLIPTFFIMIFCMGAIITPTMRKRIEKGAAPSAPSHFKNFLFFRIQPKLSIFRGIFFGGLGLLVLLPISIGLLVWLFPFPLSFKEILVMKSALGILIGLVLTPPIVISAMVDKCGS